MNHGNKIKFILCADARTGCHMLQTAINQHSEIDCFGEILNAKSKDSLLRGSSTLAAVEKAFSSPKRCSGFILHRCRQDIQEVWDYLIKDRDIRVIMIHRVDQLMRYASLKIAARTKKWIEFAGNKKNKERILYDGVEYMTKSKVYYNLLFKYQEQFRFHEGIKIHYESMVADFKNELQRIYALLGVKFEDVRPTTHMQETRSLQEIFLNYKELMQYHDNG